MSRPCAKKSQPWVLAAMILGSSMAFIDGTVVNVALPAMQQTFRANVTDLQWVVEAYALFLSAFLLLGGSAGDRYGRRRIYLFGVALFALASTWCGFAGSIGQLILARALQGIGGAFLVPGSLAIIASAFVEKDRGRAIGTWSGFSAITAAIGPLLGGYLIQAFSWRAVFFINLPLATLVVILCLWHVPESSSDEKTMLDWLGATLAAVGLGALIFGLIESSRLGFGNLSVVSSLVGSVILLTAFLFREWRTPHPMLPLSLFQSRDFVGANLLTLLLYAPLGAMLFFLPLNLIQIQHYSPTAAGAALLPMILLIFLLSRWSGGLIAQFGARIPLVIGPVIAALGFALLARPTFGGNYWQTFFPAVMTLGFGMAISVAPLTTAVMNAVAPRHVGIASGINNAVSRTAGLLAIAVLGLVILEGFNAALNRKLAGLHLPATAQSQLDNERIKLGGADAPAALEATEREEISRAIRESFVSGFRIVMLVCAGLAAASAASSWLLLSGRTAERKT